MTLGGDNSSNNKKPNYFLTLTLNSMSAESGGSGSFIAENSGGNRENPGGNRASAAELQVDVSKVKYKNLPNDHRYPPCGGIRVKFLTVMNTPNLHHINGLYNIDLF